MKLGVKINEQDSPDNGLRGKLIVSIPGKDNVYIKGMLGAQMFKQICNNLGYRQGKSINSKSVAVEKSQTFTLSSEEDNENSCLKIFYEFVAGEKFSSKKISRIKKQCISEIDKGHIQIECTGELNAISSLAAQNACGDGEFCPTGRDSDSRVRVEFSNPPVFKDSPFFGLD